MSGKSRHRKSKPARQQGWVGLRVEICGHPIPFQEDTHYCNLPPMHPHALRHVAIAYDPENANTPFYNLILTIDDTNPNEGTVECLEIEFR